MYKIIRYVICFLSTFCLFFIGSCIAQNQVHFEYIPDTYYTVKVGDYYYSYQEPFIYVNETLVYCLEPEKSVLESLEYIEGDIFDIGLTTEQLKKIELIGYYGYGYETNNNYKYYLAAQELIWQIVRPNIIMSWATTEYGNTKISVEEEKKQIMFLVENHYTLPEVTDLFLTLTLDQEMLLYDFAVLKTFRVKNDYPHTVTVIGNDLMIKTSKTYIGKSLVELEKIKRSEGGTTTIYVLDGYQSLIYPYNNDDIKVSFEIETKAGDITIKKIDSETKTSIGQGGATLEGTTFEIYDKNFDLVETLVIDETGTAKTRTLKLGEYFIQEVKSGEGYLRNYDMNSLSITVSQPHQILTYENKVIKNRIEIFKTYGNNYLLESNAEFSISDEFGNVVATVITYDGVAQIDLPYGKYNVKQTKGMKNHSFVQDFEITVTDSTPTKQTYYLHNHLIKTNLTVHKLDKVTSEVINSPAHFLIYDLDNETYLFQDGSEVFTTKNGAFQINDIALGHYRIEEASPPYGYKKGDDLEIILEENDIEKNNIDISFYNEFIVSKIQIEKNGLDMTGKFHPLDGVTFGLYALEDIIISDNIYYQKDDLIELLTTKNGFCSSKYLPVGKYYLKELQTVDGYHLSEEKYECELIDKENCNLAISNQIILGQIEVLKIGINQNREEKLDNVKFGIYALEDIKIADKLYYTKDELIEELITIDGKSISSYLPFGKYYLKELETVEGYQLGSDIYKVDIRDTTTYKCKIVNKAKIEEIIEYNIPDTEIKPKKINKMFAFIIVFFGYIIIKYAKK